MRTTLYIQYLQWRNRWRAEWVPRVSSFLGRLPWDGIALWLAILLALLLILWRPSAAYGQVVVNGGRTYLGSMDSGGAVSTRPIKTGSSLPSNCAVGEIFFHTGVAAGTNIHLCTATNTWTQVTGGGGGGGGISSLNGLTGPTQGFSTGTAGTEFNIDSSGATHTFNIPIAGVGIDAGLLTSTDWNTFNLKAEINHTHQASAIVAGQLALARGGTEANLSATGGPRQVVMQEINGLPFTVRELTDADVPNTITLDNITQITARDIGSLTGQLAVSQIIDSAQDTDFLASGGSVGPAEWRGILDDDIPDTITLTNITQITNRAIADTTGTLAIGRGGTGATSFIANRCIRSNSSGTALEVSGADCSVGGGGGAPIDATYIVQTANGTLTNEQALGALATGVLKNTTSTGVLSIATGTDLPTHASRHQHGGNDEIATATPAANAIPKADSGGVVNSGWLPNSGVSANTYGAATIVPQITVDAKGRITTATGVTITGTTPGGSATGDLNGTYPAPTVDGLQGRSIASTTPNVGESYSWSSTSSAFQPRMPYALNCKLFGAVGDGVTDDTSAVQACISALPSTGGRAYLPSGDYKISSTITLGNGSSGAESSRHQQYLVGDGNGSGSGETGHPSGARGGTRLSWYGSAGGTMLSLNGPMIGGGIEELSLDARSTAGKIIQVNHASRYTVKNIFATGWTTQAGQVTTYVRPSGVGYGACGAHWEDVFFFNPGSDNANGMELTAGASSDVDACGHNFYRVVVDYGGNASTWGWALGCTDNNTWVQSGSVSYGPTSGSGLKFNSCASNASFPQENIFINTAFGSNITGTSGTGGNMFIGQPLSDCGGDAVPGCTPVQFANVRGIAVNGALWGADGWRIGYNADSNDDYNLELRNEGGGTNNAGGILFRRTRDATSDRAKMYVEYTSGFNFDLRSGTGSMRNTISFPSEGGLKLAGFTRPTCDSTRSGQLWYFAGGSGVKDTVDICAKDAANAYAWRAIY